MGDGFGGGRGSGVDAAIRQVVQQEEFCNSACTGGITGERSKKLPYVGHAAHTSAGACAPY